MIPLSLLSVLASLGLLAVGLAATSQVLVLGSLGASVAAGVFLSVSVLQRRGRVSADVPPSGDAPLLPVDLGGPQAGPPPPYFPPDMGQPGPGHPGTGYPGFPGAGFPGIGQPDAAPASTGRAPDDAVTEEMPGPADGAPAAAPADDADAAVRRPEAADAGTAPLDTAAGVQPPAQPETSRADRWPAEVAQPPAAQPPAGQPPAGQPPAGQPPAAQPPAAQPPAGQPPAGERPAAEPAEEDIPVGAALRAAQLDDEVLVVDGRPRYHLAGCAFLAGKPTVPLPLSTARRTGFTPCGLCRPDSTLLARASSRRR